MDLSYVLPLRWQGDDGLEELTRYLRWLSARCEVIVVDGSPVELFTKHARLWQNIVEHLAPGPGHKCLNGKVGGVIAGINSASCEHVIIADDDVRYDDKGLLKMQELLQQADLVRPQNYFAPLPWHAAWDSARSLLNRAYGADYPGTFGLRKSLFIAMGGYDGDVLFENLELMRTVKAAGGTITTCPDLYVRRVPSTARRFWSQRTRQAYDDFAQPSRMAFFLLLIPAGIGLAKMRRFGAIYSFMGASIALAERGRRLDGGARVFPPRTSLFAPAWVAERAVCCWLALANRVFRGGCPYGDAIIRRAATPYRQLERRMSQRRPLERSQL